MIKINLKRRPSLLLLSGIALLGGCMKNLSSNIDSHLLEVLRHHEVNIDLNQPALESMSYKTVGVPVLEIPQAMQQFIIRYETATPTQHTQVATVLEKCRLIGLRVEIDNKESTAEWMITPDNACPSNSANKVKTFWIVQRDNEGKQRVLVVDRTQLLSLPAKKPLKNALKVIKTSIEVTRPSRFSKESLPVMCHTFWQANNEAVYVRQKGFVEVYREDAMLPNKQWMPVHGKDDWAKVSEHFECPVN